MKLKSLRAYIALVFVLMSPVTFGQKHIIPPPTLPLELPRTPPCIVQGTPLDLEKIRNTQGVESIVADESKLKITVLFDDADVVKVMSSGCYAREIDVWVWTEASEYDAPALRQKAKKITDMLLDASRAQRIDQSMDAASFNSGNLQSYSVEGPGFAIRVTRVPLGGINALMKITYPDNSGEGYR